MSEWVHADSGVRCALCAAGWHLVCTTPTPDPTSPCGTVRFGVMCGFRAPDHTPTGHPHVPTLCTCGHPIRRDDR